MSAFSIRQSFYPVFLTSIGFSTAALGAVMSILGLAHVVSRPMLPPTLRWLGPVRLLAAIAGLIAVTLAITPSLRTFGAIAGAIAMLGIAMGLLGPLSTTWITERVPSATWGSAISLRVMALQCAQLIGPSVSGLIVGGFGVPAAFYYSALVAAAALWLVAALARGDRA
jgi:predicted MFS family arabinose efflux permease